MIRILKTLGLNDIELKSFLNVGSPRIIRVVPNKPKAPRKATKHAASDSDTSRIVNSIMSLDLQPGYPCAHRSIPLYIEGEDQGSS